MRSLEQLDRWIAGKVKNWSSRISGEAHPKELLEIRRDILEDVRDRIQPKGEGRSVFAYNTIEIRIGAEDAEQHEAWEAAFTEGDGLQHDVEGLLAQAGCPVPAGLSVQVHVAQDAGLAAATRPFQIDYSNRKREMPAPAARPKLKLTVVRGQADAAEYTFAAERVNIGRLKEVVGEKDGLRRRNDVAFDEAETTVSREHASIRYDADSGKFRLYDSGSQRGSSVFREGRRLEALRIRGVQLQPGDEIHLGEARIKFELA